MKFINDPDTNKTTVAFDYAEVDGGGKHLIGVIYDAEGHLIGIEISMPYFYGGTSYQAHIGGDTSPFYWWKDEPDRGSYDIPGGFNIRIPRQTLVPSNAVIDFPTQVAWERCHKLAPWSTEPEMADHWSSLDKVAALNWLQSQIKSEVAK